MTRTFSKQKSTMRPLATLLVLAAVTLLAACASTPESRIADHYGVFAEFPPDVRQKIRAGQVDLGFTPEMVQLALGKPARQFTSKNENGEAETWVYHKTGPRFGFGFGVASFGRHSATSVGVATSTGGYDPEERMRVEFRNGVVSAVDHVKS